MTSATRAWPGTVARRRLACGLRALAMRLAKHATAEGGGKRGISLDFPIEGQGPVTMARLGVGPRGLRMFFVGGQSVPPRANLPGNCWAVRFDTPVRRVRRRGHWPGTGTSYGPGPRRHPRDLRRRRPLARFGNTRRRWLRTGVVHTLKGHIMNYRVVWKPSPGLTMLSQPGDAGMQHLSFGMIALAPGERYRLAPCDQETALVLLKGEAVISGKTLSRQTIGPRGRFLSREALDGVPARTKARVKSRLSAIARSPSARLRRRGRGRRSSFRRKRSKRSSWASRASGERPG